MYLTQKPMSPYSCSVSIPFPSERLATIAMRSVAADKEPRKSGNVIPCPRKLGG